MVHDRLLHVQLADLLLTRLLLLILVSRVCACKPLLLLQGRKMLLSVNLLLLLRLLVRLLLKGWMLKPLQIGRGLPGQLPARHLSR